jgi:hypothetical protein
MCNHRQVKIAGTDVRAGSLAFWGISAIPVIVVLALPALVLQDGGLHIANAVAMNGLIRGWWPALVEWRPALLPYLTSDVALTGLIQVMDGNTALKVVAAIGLIAFSLAVASLMRAVHLPLAAGIPLLAFEMSYLFMLGFIGFVWSTALCLFAVAVALRQPLRPAAIPLTLLLTATWFTHFVPAVIATIAIVLIVLFAHLAEGEALAKASYLTIRTLALPAGLMVVLSLCWNMGRGQSAGFQAWSGIVDSASLLIQLFGPLVMYTRAEVWLGRLLALALIFTSILVVAIRVRDRRYRDRYDGILVSALLLGATSLVLARDANNGVGYVNVRISLFAPIFLAVWLCTQLPELRGRASTAWWGAAAIAAAVAVALPIVRVPALRHLAGEVQRIGNVGACLPERATFVQLDLDDTGGVWSRGTPMSEQASGAFGVARQALDLGNEAGWYPQAIWRYKTVARADRFMDPEKPDRWFDSVPPPMQMARAVRGGLPLDAVVLYGRDNALDTVLKDSSTVALQNDLEQFFTKVRVSPENNAELWLRKGMQPAC